MKHAAVLELRIRNPFYTDGWCRDLSITPAHETALLLERRRCVLRSGAGVARVITPLDDAGGPLMPLPAGASLLFELRATNGDLALFTDLSAIRGTPSPLFTNAALAAAAGGELELTTRTTTDPETGLPVPARQAPGVLAEVEIVLHPGSGHGRALPAAVFQVSFQQRRWHWAYYCITHLTAGGSALTIKDASPTGAPGALSFGVTWIDQEHQDPSDPIATQLVARNPGMNIARYVTSEAVACLEGSRALELRLGDDLVSSPLPNPTVRSFTQRRLPPPAQEVQDLLFQIIEYPARPLANH